MISNYLKITSLALLATCLSPVSWAQDQAPTGDAGTLTKEDADRIFKGRPYSPYAGRDFPMRPLFGDTHLHTAFSFDAGAFGARLGPQDAYDSPRARRSRRRAGSR